MKRFLVFSIKKHPIVSTVLAIGLIALVYFAGSFASNALYFNDPKHQQRDLEAWMSPRYVGQSWQLPRDEVFAIMQMDIEAPPKEGPRTLADVMAQTGMTLEELQAKVEAAKADQISRRKDDKQ